MNLISQIKQLHELIEKDLGEQQFERVIAHLTELEKLAKTEKYYIGYSTVMFYMNDIENAKRYIEEGLRQFSYSFSLHFNAVILSYIHGELENTFKHIGYSIKYSETTDQEEAVNKKLNEIYYELLNNNYEDSYLQQLLNLAENIRVALDERMYPVDGLKRSLIRKVMDKNTDYENMTNLYKNVIFGEINEDTRHLTKSELFIGHEDKSYSFYFETKTTLPLSLIVPDTNITMTYNDAEYVFQNSLIKFNQFNYLTFEPGSLEIKTDKPIFIGEPIPLRDKEKKQHKLIMHVFIDGLSAKFLEDQTEDLLPNVKNAFQNKYVNKNCYASADWTFPSNAGLFTAMDTITNGQYHPTFPHNFSEKCNSLVETIRKNGYYTTSINSCWRTTPRQGYGSSFNRVVFKNSVGGFGVAEKIDEVIDHLDAFKDKNHYIWLGIPDLHDVPDEIFRSINTQVSLDALDRMRSDKGKTSVLSSFNTTKVKRYKEEIKRIDLHLSRLFEFVKSRYNEEEVLIIIHSDHGQGFLQENQKQFLHEERTKVPFMLLGGVDSKESNELMSNLDIYPTVLDILGIVYEKNKLHGKCLKDFGGEARKEVLTETYHPDQTYKAMIKTEQIQMYFETEDKVDQWGRVDLSQYRVTYDKLSQLVDDKDALKQSEYYTDWILKNRALLQK